MMFHPGVIVSTWGSASRDEVFRNGYPCNFIDVCIKRFLNNIFIDKKVYAPKTKKELVCVQPFIEV